MTQPRAMTLIKMNPPSEREDEWNEWYSTVHSPGRFECGLETFRRFELMPNEPPVDTQQPGMAKYLAIMEWPDTSCLTSDAYNAVTERWTALPSDSWEHVTMTLPNFARGVFEQIGSYPTGSEALLPETKYVFLSAHEVPVAIQDEFNDYYVMEHMPLVLDVPGINSVRRFFHRSDEFPAMLSNGGELFTHLALWEIESEKVFHDPKFASYTPTAWQQRLRKLFTIKMSNVYKEISRGSAA